MKIIALIAFLRIYSSLSTAGAFSPANKIGNIRSQSQSALLPERWETKALVHQSQSEVIDAEVVPEKRSRSNSSSSSSSASNQALNLIEYSQNQDPDWKSMQIAFCDTESNTYIDCHLAFYVKDPLADSSGCVEYALGVPSEVPIVVAMEPHASNVQKGGEEDGTVVNLSKVIPINPDNDSEGSSSDEQKEEIFEIAARALKSAYGDSIRLKKTPRTLTVEGDLEAAMGDWKNILSGNKAGGKGDLSLEDALAMADEDIDDDGEDFFDKIMSRDLGPDYMNLVDDEDEIDEDLLQLFDTAGLDADVSDLAQDIITQEKNMPKISYDELIQQLQPSAAMKLLNFLGPGGREYIVLRPLRPILLIGKEDPDDYTRRILLTEEERKVILPRLESTCLEGLEKAGFFFAGSGNAN